MLNCQQVITEYAISNRQHIHFRFIIIFIITIRQMFHMPFAIPSMAHLAVVIQLIMLLYHWTFAAMSLVAMMTAQALTQPWMVTAGRMYHTAHQRSHPQFLHHVPQYLQARSLPYLHQKLLLLALQLIPAHCHRQFQRILLLHRHHQPQQLLLLHRLHQLQHFNKRKIRPVVLLTRMRKDMYFGMFMTVNHVTVV
jgi:hypothetical protein